MARHEVDYTVSPFEIVKQGLISEILGSEIMTFIPEKPQSQRMVVPFYEDITAKDVPGRRAEKEHEYYQKQIRELLLQLGAGRVNFIPGTHDERPKRYGFQITFSLNGIPGRIDVAALPMRHETPTKKKQALAQALFLVRDWLSAELYSAIYRPGSIALVPYLIGDRGKTVTEALVELQMLPLLEG